MYHRFHLFLSLLCLGCFVGCQPDSSLEVDWDAPTDSAEVGTTEPVESEAAFLPGFDDKLTDSFHGFSEQQGAHGWNYGYLRTSSASLQKDMPGKIVLLQLAEKGWWKHGAAAAPAISASSFVASSGLAALRRWTPELDGGVRIVGSLQKPDATADAELRVLVDGKMVWSRQLASSDILRYGFDIAVPGLTPKTPIDFVVLTNSKKAELQTAFEIIPEPFLSTWSPTLPDGYPTWPEAERKVLRERGQAVLEQIRQASASGAGQVRIAPGEYLFHADYSGASTLKGLADLEIVAEGVTFWFEPRMVHGLLFEHCRDVTVRGLTIDFTLPIFSQARITEIDRSKKSIRAELMSGYEPRDQFGKLETAGERKLIFYDADGRFINHRHTRSDWTLSGNTMVYAKARVNPIPSALKVGDYVVSPIQTGAALRSKECARMRFEDVNIWSSPGMAVYEGLGEGGHVYQRLRATRRPHTNRLQAFGADVFHLSAADRGPILDRCESAYGADDNLNIHGRFGRVIERVDATHYYLDGVYETGDTLEFRDFSTVELLGIAKAVSVKQVTDGPSLAINEKYSAKGEYLIELDKPLELPPLSFVVFDGKRSADGFIVRDCWFHDNFQRTLINGAPNGLIENTTLQNVGHGINIQFETWGPWMEGPFARNMVVRNNRFLNASPSSPVLTVSMHPAGGGTTRRRLDAKPVTNLRIEGNLIDRASGARLNIHNVDGLFIEGNHIEGLSVSGQSDGFKLQDCDNVISLSSARADGGAGVVREHLGLPQLFIDGTPHNGLTFTTYDQVREEYQEFADVGVDLFSFVISPTGCAYHNIQRKPENFDLWVAPDRFDFANFDERIDRVLSANPDAKIFPRLSLSAPLWWIRENPGEMGLGTDKAGKTVRLSDGGRQGPSWASEQWREDTLMALRRLLEHVDASDYADNIVGWHLVSGSTEEWMIWGSNGDQWGDISEPSQARFRQWLRERYLTDAALQSAWHDTTVTLDTAQIASRAQREQTTLGSFTEKVNLRFHMRL